MAANKHEIAQFRKRTRRTQKALARELDVTHITVSRWERGDRKISLKLLPIVSRLTGIPAAVLRPDIAAKMGAD